jgi:serine O-acetyltransferase
MNSQLSNAQMEALQHEHDHCTACACFRDKTWQLADAVMGLLYPQHAPKGANIPENLAKVEQLLASILTAMQHPRQSIENHTKEFTDALPNIKAMAEEDAQAIMDHDPAAESIVEIKLAYPGFYATAIYRIANQLLSQGIELLPRLMTEYAHRQTGIDIHPGAKIASPFVIDHGTGIVIGQTAEIGTGVIMYQGVTLGASVVNKSLAQKKRHPTIGNDVILYAGATILGGETVIGDRSIIGGNVWLTESVPADSVVTHKPEIRVKHRTENLV